MTACGSVHPGAAAVVDGKTISMKALNDTAEVYCTLTLSSAEAQGASVPDNADLRRQAVTSLVSTVVARRLAEDAGVTPRPSEYKLTADQQDQIAKAFPDGDVEQIGRAIEDSQEISAIAVALGEKSTGQLSTSTTEAQLAELGQNQIIGAFADNDVTFAPRFGLTGGSRQIAPTGSLSVPAADLGAAESDQLPAAQRCS